MSIKCYCIVVLEITVLIILIMNFIIGFFEEEIYLLCRQHTFKCCSAVLDMLVF